jgi:prepilin-type N-terminal cleavage/methylation domain-containing protein
MFCANDGGNDFRSQRRAAPSGGFTLIELLIVVAIIAILAAIAVPNFLEATVRAKVARGRSDLRSCAVALEAYYTDNNAYPNMRESGFAGGPSPIQGSELKWWYVPNALSTPIAYLNNAAMHCPFGGNWDKAAFFPDDIWRRYGYENIVELIDKADAVAVLQRRYHAEALGWSGPWRLQCVGPDRLWNPSTSYDPTNGAVSGGDIIRTQKTPIANTNQLDPWA